MTLLGQKFHAKCANIARSCSPATHCESSSILKKKIGLLYGSKIGKSCNRTCAASVRIWGNAFAKWKVRGEDRIPLRRPIRQMRSFRHEIRIREGGRNDGMTEWQNGAEKGRLTLASSFVIQSYRQTDDGSFGRSLTMTICND